MAEADRLFGTIKADEMVKSLEELPTWSRSEVLAKHGKVVRSTGNTNGGRRRVLLLIEGCVVDVGGYLEDHVRPPPFLGRLPCWVGWDSS